MSRPRKTDWNAIDWNLPNKTIAAQTGVSAKLVSKWRAKLQAPRSAKPSHKFKQYIDFDKTNRELAAEHGVSRKYVSTLRRKWGAKPSSDSNAFAAAHTRDWTSVDWSQPVRAIARRTNCSPTTVSRMRKKLRLPKVPHHLNQ